MWLIINFKRKSNSLRRECFVRITIIIIIFWRVRVRWKVTKGRGSCSFFSDGWECVSRRGKRLEEGGQGGDAWPPDDGKWSRLGSFTLIQYTVSHSPCRSLALLVSATPNVFVFLNLVSPNHCRYYDSKGVFSGDVYMMCLRTPLRKYSGGNGTWQEEIGREDIDNYLNEKATVFYWVILLIS